MIRAVVEEQLTATVARMASQFRAGEAFLAELARPANLRELLGTILSDDGWIQDVADSSYRHALGFDKLVLAPLWPCAQLRMHVWWPGQNRIVEHIHNHRFSLASAVVVGRVRNQLYIRAQSGLESTERIGYVEDGRLEAKEWRFSRGRTDILSLFASMDMFAGSTYSLHSDVLHQVVVSDSLTITLFIEGVASSPASFVFVEANDAQPSPAAQIRLSVASARERLERVIARLDGPL